MARATSQAVRIRLVIERPVPGVGHGLQAPDGHPLDVKRSTGGALVFEFDLGVTADRRLVGPYVRREGPERRFFYVVLGESAGDVGSPWKRRMKLDLHTLTAAQLERGLAGDVLELAIDGTGKDGSPACATVPPLRAWRVVSR